MSTVTMSCKEHSISQTSATSSGSYILPTTSSAKFLALWVGGNWFSLPIYDWAFTISYVQHFDQFWVCTNCCHRKGKLLWPALRTTQIYSYKYKHLNASLTIWSFSKTVIVGAPPKLNLQYQVWMNSHLCRRSQIQRAVGYPHNCHATTALGSTSCLTEP